MASRLSIIVKSKNTAGTKERILKLAGCLLENATKGKKGWSVKKSKFLPNANRYENMKIEKINCKEFFTQSFVSWNANKVK